MDTCKACGCDPCDCGWGNYIKQAIKLLIKKG